MELRAVLGREYKRSLKTRDPVEAKYEFARAWAASEEAFAAARAQLKGVETISAFDAQQLAARWFRAEQEKLERTGQLAAVLGIQYKAIGNGDYNHSTALILLDGDGHIVGRTSQLGDADPAFVKLVKKTPAATR